MRKGQNPVKHGIRAYAPQPLGIVLLVHIPSQDGYFADLLEIFSLQVASIHRHTSNFDLCVIDNGSAPEVQAKLQSMQARGLITWLFLSRENLGKTGALNWALASLPNAWIAFSDGDVLFRPGWWQATQNIFTAFPEAAMVSAQPAFFDVLKGHSRAYERLQSEKTYRVEKKILPEGVRNDYIRGLGKPAAEVPFVNTPIPVLTDTNDVSAAWGATHMQFVIRNSAARQVTPLPADFALSSQADSALHRRLDDLGFLQLSTLENHVFHMGNTLDEQLLAETKDLRSNTLTVNKKKKSASTASYGPRMAFALRMLNAACRLPGASNLLRQAYNLLYIFFAQNNK